MSGRNQKQTRRLIGWTALALFSLVASAALVTHLEALYDGAGITPGYRLQSYAASDKSWTGTDPRVSRTLKQDDRSVSADYRFVSFHNDPVQVEARVAASAYRDYRQAFGYRQRELDALFQRQHEQLEAARRWAVDNHASQAQLDRAAAEIRDNYDRSVSTLLTTRGFRFLKTDLLAADIPAIVKNNVALFQPVARTLQETMNTPGDSATDLISTALSLVQTAIDYEELPMEQNGRITAGFSPPLEVFMEGRGDCDAKSALLAAILLNWDSVKLIGVGVPGHYLLGILQHPGKGDAVVDYEGLTYVLMEPSGPAWVPPGFISDYTLKWLAAQDQAILEPLSLN